MKQQIKQIVKNATDCHLIGVLQDALDCYDDDIDDCRCCLVEALDWCYAEQLDNEYVKIDKIWKAL